MFRTKTLATLLFASISLCLWGCEAPKWDDPNYVNKKLLDEDRGTRSLAMSNLSSLKDEDKPKIVPGLINIYNNDTVLKKDAMTQLLQIKSPEAKDAYLHELKTNETDYAVGAADTIATLKDKSLNKELLSIYKSTDKDDVKIAILRALDAAPTGELVPALVETLKLDVDRRPIALLSYSCDILAKIAIEDPKAISEETIKQVTLAMFFANRTNQTLDKACGLTVQAIGNRAIPELVKIYKGEREDIKELFLKYDTQDNPYSENLAKLVAVQRLVTLRAKELISLATEDLKTVKKAPSQLNTRAAVDWRMKEGQTTSEEIYALGDLQDQEALPLLESIMKGDSYIHKEWEDIVDKLVELEFRQDASFALVRIGNRAALPSLLSVAQNGVIEDWEKSAVALEKRNKPVAPLTRYQMNWLVAESYANLALPENRKDFEALITAKRALSTELADKLQSMLPMFDVAAECMGKGDPKAQAECYGGKISDEKDEYARTKAAWELGRLPKEAALDQLNKNLPTKYLDTREIVEFYLYAMGDKSSVKVIDKILEDEANAGSKFALDHYRLQLLRYFLLNRAAGN